MFGLLLALLQFMPYSNYQESNHLSKLLDNLSSAVLFFNHHMILKFMNSAAEIMFAISAHHMLNQKAEHLLQCSRHNISNSLSRALNNGTAFTEREMILNLPEDRQITVNCTVTPLMDNIDQLGLIVELQQVDRQLQISRDERLLNQNLAIRDIVRGMAHEIKNPLGGLRGAAQLLEQELPNDELKEYTQIIIEEADRLQNLVNRMLGPNNLPQLSDINIHHILERVRQLVLVESAHSVEIWRDYDPSIPELSLDNDRMVQAFLNLMRNAVQATENQALRKITLKTRILRKYTIGHIHHKLVVKISIIDNGIGISESIRENLFFPMVTTKEHGVGLGLSISQSLINQHHGLIECKSKSGLTTFNVLIPLETTNV